MLLTLLCRRFPPYVLCSSRLLKSTQNRRKPAISSGSEHLHLSPMRLFDRLNQPPLLLGLELLPRGEVAPPRLEGGEEALQEQRHAARPGPEVIGEVRARGRPAQGRAERYGAVEIADVDHPREHEIDAFPPDGRGDASH